MASRWPSVLFCVAMPTASALAQSPAMSPDTPMERVEDIARTPLDTLNIDKDDVPDKLFLVQFDPYDLSGMTSCAAIEREVRELTALLGPDVDMGPPGEQGWDETAADIGTNVIKGLIPFRGLIREVSGAAAKDRRIAVAVWRGAARRSYLKGVGLAWGCAWPAAPVPKLVYDLRGF